MRAISEFMRHFVALPWGRKLGPSRRWRGAGLRWLGSFRRSVTAVRAEGAQWCWRAVRRHRVPLDRSRPYFRLVLELLAG